MDLRGAKIQSFFKITADVKSDDDSSSTKEVRIPHYQRPYKWGEEQISKLINDWHTEGENKYFAGSIVTVADNDQRHQLIDGQQRFTTSFLTNFIRFLLTRILLREGISGYKVYFLQGILDQYKDSVNYLFSNSLGNKALLSDIAEIESIIHEFAGNSDPSNIDEKTRTNTLDKLLPLLGLPKTSLNEADPEYAKMHKALLHKFIVNKANTNNEPSLSLTYDRQTYNNELLETLTSTCITLGSQSYPEIYFLVDEEETSDTIKNYINALKCIFTQFNEIKRQEKKCEPFQFTLSLTSKINDFLNKVSFCVVQTGNLNDAYTLFEVLNDRALALDDLDLIKNQLYKKFVTANENIENITPSDIDNTIQHIDEQWVSKIFKDEIDSKRHTIAYLAIVFITGSTSIKNRDGVSYRSSIESYLAGLETYSPEDIKRHFNIFHCAKIFLEIFDIKFGNQTYHALKNELEINSSMALKTAHFLVAIDQIGVLSGLFNFMLKYISIHDNNPEFCPQKVMASFNQMTSDKCPDEIKNQSYEIWKVAMLAKSAEKPREFAKQLIQDNNLNTQSYRPNYLASDSHSELIVDFENWLRTWQYRPKSPKIRLLFAKLFKLTKKPNGDLVQQVFSSNLANKDVADLQLDHMEPISFNPSNSSAYFQSHDRKQHVDGLGNMMPLPKQFNIKKRNDPLRTSFKHYHSAGLTNTFLLQDAESLYNKNHDAEGAPTSTFFEERKEFLIDDFKKAVKIKPEF